MPSETIMGPQYCYPTYSILYLGLHYSVFVWHTPIKMLLYWCAGPHVNVMLCEVCARWGIAKQCWIAPN